jgi:phenylalanyl-tRNA synthetase beta chain
MNRSRGWSASASRCGARDAASVTVAVPSWRNDVAGDLSAYRAGGGVLTQFEGLDPARAAKAAEGQAAVEPECDLVEEVLRLGGLDAVPPVSLPALAVIPPPAFTAKQARAALARRVLAARGMQESVTFAFMEAKTAALFGPAAERQTPWSPPEALRLVNPIAADLDQMRPTPVASLLLAAQRNAARGFGMWRCTNSARRIAT